VYGILAYLDSPSFCKKVRTQENPEYAIQFGLFDSIVADQEARKHRLVHLPPRERFSSAVGLVAICKEAETHLQ